MLIGVLAGLTTGALWGLTFIAPLAVRPFTGWDLTVVRYEVFGLASLLLMISPRFRPGPTTLRQIAVGLLLGGIGFTSYVCLVFFAVDLAGPVIPPLIIGTTPLVMALVTNRAGDKVPWRMLALPLALISAGLLVVNIAALWDAPKGRPDAQIGGALCSVLSMVVWILYAVINKRITQGADAPDTLRWTGLQGIGAALGSLCLLPLTSFMSGGPGAALLHTSLGTNFLAWCLAMGVGGSWIATFCWVVASRRLPLALAGQLIAGETIFGLIYGFIYEGRWPALAEGTGAALQIGGVFAAVALFHRYAAAAAEPPEAALALDVAASGSALR